MKIFIYLFFLIISNSLLCCDIVNNNPLSNWLGNSSQFSKDYIKGKCALDTVLKNMSIQEKIIITNLIVKSYTLDSKFRSSKYYK